MSFRRVTIVTGAAQGIGQAIALRLAKDGLDVVVSDLSSKMNVLEAVVDDIRTQGRNALAVPADVSVEEDVKNLVAATVDKFGGLDVMVAAAGICEFKPFLDNFDDMLSTNSCGVFLCYQVAAKVMVQQNYGGRLIAACSVSGKKGFPASCAYTASKFAVRGITQVAALDLEQYGITVNAYAPGAINTLLLRRIATGPGAVQTDAEELTKNTALRRMGQPDDIANVISFLASE